MNLRIVFHLLASDFRRFKWLLSGLWACVIFSALPWLFFEPDSEVMLEDKVPLLDWIGSWLGLCYAAALGLGYREWGLVKPVRKRELVAARVCSLVLWILVPEGLLVGINLLVHGLGAEPALLVTLAEVATEFPGCRVEHRFSGERRVVEGTLHHGVAHVAQLVARRD